MDVAARRARLRAAVDARNGTLVVIEAMEQGADANARRVPSTVRLPMQLVGVFFAEHTERAPSRQDPQTGFGRDRQSVSYPTFRFSASPTQWAVRPGDILTVVETGRRYEVSTVRPSVAGSTLLGLTVKRGT